MTEQAQTSFSAGSPVSVLASLSRNANAEIVTARKVTHAKAPVVTHFRTHSKSGSVELRKQSPSAQEVAAGVGGSPRILPSPVPPPSSALPPTPASPSVRVSLRDSGSSFATSTTSTAAVSAPSILAKSIRKTSRHLSAGLTPEEHNELVQKILTDLRPASHPRAGKPFSRASRSSSITVAAPSQPKPKAASAKMVLSKSDGPQEVGIAAGKRLRVSSAVSSEMTSSGDEKKGGSDSATPQLSQSRTPTSTTPASQIATSADNSQTQTPGAGEKDVLTPTSALESLRVLEQSFSRSNPNSPLQTDFTSDSKVSQTTTAVTSPTESETAANGTASRPKAKRNSPSRESVPILDQLGSSKKGPGIDSNGGSGSAASSERASSPPSATAETPSWISPLTTLEAIRVLAFQQANGEQPRSPTVPEAAAVTASDAASSDEVSALRYALNFTLARADKLAEALNRANEDKMKVETELEILRRNVLSMLSSKSMFSTPTPTQPQHQGGDILEEEDSKLFEDAMARHTPAATERALPAAVSRPPCATRTTKPAAPSAKPAEGVSIASLRKKNPSINTTSAKRYAPPTCKTSTTTTDKAYEAEEDEDEFDMYPFGAPVRKPLPEVSMSDFLNASRMSKTEIDEHDARRELDREEDGPEYAGSSTSSHVPLAASYSMRSLDSNKRGFFKGITKLVDQERAKRFSRRQSLVSKPSMSSLIAPGIATVMSRSASTNNMQGSGGFTMAYEESIIPAYPGTEGRNHKALSISNSLRESLERQSLREAGIRGVAQNGKKSWVKGGEAFAVPLI
ncbi:uncharacterized protein UBRO_16325 [Ustilago bromivora]|uniref:Uncharacterized protein n=1 Tax=Ustilago bromivora TaxID=307758 RepID=A0A1K0FXI5_9BASI|nr:uncharacterized protein UBRO_16325 [Ustilago bromivora]SYW79164.1 uncharacterized protein UBRO2_02848 [Ustilago bromivora]